MTIQHPRSTCWITKASDIHLECVILIAFPWQQWLRECASVLRYTYIGLRFCAACVCSLLCPVISYRLTFYVPVHQLADFNVNLKLMSLKGTIFCRFKLRVSIVQTYGGCKICCLYDSKFLRTCRILWKSHKIFWSVGGK